MHQESPDNFNGTLVTLVQSFPCLYDTTMPDYHDASARENAWIEIAQGIGTGITPTECRTKWSLLYECFASSFSSDPDLTEKSGDLTKSLEFLKPFSSGFKPDSPQPSNDDELSPDCKPCSEVVIKQEAEAETLQDGEPHREIIKEETAESPPPTRKYVAIDASDSDSLFLLSLLPDMKQMGEERRQLFKARLLEINEEMTQRSDNC